MNRLLYILLIPIMFSISCDAKTTPKTTQKIASQIPAPSYVWSKYNTNISGIIGMACLKNGKVLISSDGVIVSRDHGKHWNRIENGIRSRYIECLATDRTGMLFLSTGLGLYNSADGGSHWKLTKPGIAGVSLCDLVFDKQNRMYVIVTGNSLFSSNDGGNHWKQTCAEKKGLTMMNYSIAVNSRGDIFGTLDEGIYCCRKGSGKWKKVNLGSLDGYVETIVCDKQDRLFASVVSNRPPFDPNDPSGSISSSESPILRSTDSGKHWVGIRPNAACNECNSFAFGPKNEIIAATDQGVFVSYNAGDHWTNVTDTVDDPDYPETMLKVAIDKEGRIYAFGASGNIFVGTPKKS